MMAEMSVPTPKGKHNEPKKAKYIIAGLVGLIVAAAVILGVVYGTKKSAPANSANGPHQVIGFGAKGTKAAFMTHESEFINSLAFVAMTDASNIHIFSYDERTVTGKLYILVSVAAADQATLNSEVTAIQNGWQSQEISKYGITAFYATESDIPQDNTSAPTTSPVTTTPPASTDAPTTAAMAPFAIKINCGGTFDYVDTDGTVWITDAYFTGGVPWKKVGLTGNTVYDTERFFQNLIDNEGYHVPVPQNGQYAVNLTFVELTQTLPNMRVFQTTIEGINPVGMIDIFAEVNATGVPYFVNQIVNVVDQVIDIKFIKIKQNPKISGIEIHSL